MRVVGIILLVAGILAFAIPSITFVTVHEFMLAGATGEGNQPGQLEDSS